MISEEFDAGGYGIGVAMMARGKTGMVNDIKFIEKERDRGDIRPH